MRRLTAAVMAVALMSGCSTYAGSKTTAKVGGIMMGGGFVVWSAGVLACKQQCNDFSPPSAVAFTGLLALLLSIPTGISGLTGMAVYPYKPTFVERRLRALKIKEQSAETARAGDCTYAVGYDREVRDLDPEFHADVFMRDAGIKRCLDEGSADQWPRLSP